MTLSLQVGRSRFGASTQKVPLEHPACAQVLDMIHITDLDPLHGYAAGILPQQGSTWSDQTQKLLSNEHKYIYIYITRLQKLCCICFTADWACWEVAKTVERPGSTRPLSTGTIPERIVKLVSCSSSLSVLMSFRIRRKRGSWLLRRLAPAFRPCLHRLYRPTIEIVSVWYTDIRDVVPNRHCFKNAWYMLDRSSNFRA
jgi:hypothetical protein